MFMLKYRLVIVHHLNRVFVSVVVERTSERRVLKVRETFYGTFTQESHLVRQSKTITVVLRSYRTPEPFEPCLSY